MKELGGFIALCFLGMLWIEKTSRVFSVEGDVKFPIGQNELAPVIGEEIYLVADSVFQKAEGIALQKTKEEIERFNASIKYKLDILNGLEAFKGKSLEEMAARAMLGPLTDSDNADTWIKFQKAITTIYQEKNYVDKADLIFSKFLFSEISYTQKDKTDAQGKFKLDVPTQGTWYIACKNSDSKTLLNGSEIEANTFFWFFEVPVDGFRSSALLGKYRMPFQPKYKEYINLSNTNLFKPKIKV